MTITFPRDDIFTLQPILTRRFALQWQQEISTLRGGQIRVRDYADPIWTADFETVRLSYDECVEFEAVLSSLRGSMFSFLAWDTRRAEPMRYPRGVFPDLAKVGSVSQSRDSILLTGLASGFQLSVGDYIGVSYTSSGETFRTAVRCLEAVTANTEGTTSLFRVEPWLPALVALGSSARLKNPPVRMNIVPGSVRYNEASSLVGTVAFSAQEYR